MSGEEKLGDLISKMGFKNIFYYIKPAPLPRQRSGEERDDKLLFSSPATRRAASSLRHDEAEGFHATISRDYQSRSYSNPPSDDSWEETSNESRKIVGFLQSYGFKIRETCEKGQPNIWRNTGSLHTAPTSYRTDTVHIYLPTGKEYELAIKRLENAVAIKQLGDNNLSSKSPMSSAELLNELATALGVKIMVSGQKIAREI